MTPSLFISYSRREAPFVDSLYEALDDHGLVVWLDYHSLIPAQPWQEQIFKGIDEADILLLVISAESMQSKNVEPEWRRAIEHKKRIILIIFEATLLPPELVQCEWIDFRTSFKSGLKELLGQINSPVKEAQSPPQHGFKAPLIVWVSCAVSVIVAILALPTLWTIYLPYYLLPLPYRILKRDFDFFHVQSKLILLPFAFFMTDFVFFLRTDEVPDILYNFMFASLLFAPVLILLLRSSGMQRWGKPIASRPIFAKPYKPDIKNPRPTSFTVDFAPEDQKYAADLIEGLQKYGHPYRAGDHTAEVTFVLISKYKRKTDYPLEKRVVYPIILEATKDINRDLQRIQWIDFRRGLRHVEVLAQLLPEPTRLLKALGIVPLGSQTVLPSIIQALIYFLTILAMFTLGSSLVFLYRARAELSTGAVSLMVGQLLIFLSVVIWSTRALINRSSKLNSLRNLSLLIVLFGFLTFVQFVTVAA
ncbi:MAG: toll/interleukin-1 receptor domain-containing protein, partial [Anaerolineae bacterium]